MKATTAAQISESNTLHKMKHPEDYKLLEAAVTEGGDVIYTVRIKTWPAIKLATKHFYQAYGPVLKIMSVLTLVALLLIIFGG